MQFSPNAYSSFFGPNTFLSALCPNTLSICSFLKIRDHVSCPYRTTGKIIVFYIIIFTISRADEKTEASGLNGSMHYYNSKK
jgi:hypothetical protein